VLELHQTSNFSPVLGVIRNSSFPAKRFVLSFETLAKFLALISSKLTVS